jgi:dTDP-4-dehydrorhamnose 3,5-epimerase
MQTTNIDGLTVYQVHEFTDLRGSFKKIFNLPVIETIIQKDFKIQQVNVSKNRKLGTVRGMPLQRAPFEEFKIIFCTKGHIRDVVIDLRQESKSYLQIFSIDLHQSDKNSVIIPPGCAHGYQSISDETELVYLSDKEYDTTYEIGVNPRDPIVLPHWPLTISNLSERDSKLPNIHQK